MELSLASGSLLGSPAGSAPGGELVGLRRVAHGQQRPDGDSKNEDGDDDDYEDFHRILLLDGCSPLGRVCCASASTVPLEFGVLGHIERDGYLPRAGANTPADAGLTRCARLWPRAVQPSRFVRSQPVYPATGPPRCKRWSRTVGTRTLPRHAPLPRGRRSRVVDRLGCLHRFYWCRACDVYGRGTACWTCTSTRVQWDHVPPLELGRERWTWWRGGRRDVQVSREFQPGVTRFGCQPKEQSTMTLFRA